MREVLCGCGLGGGSAVYLESRWVMTAAHVGEGDILFDNATFSAVSGSTHRLTNPDGTDTDIILFRLASDPGLPSLTIRESAPDLDSAVVMIGVGRNSEEDVTRWNSDWEEDSEGETEGYKWASGRTKGWGENTIEKFTTANAGEGDVLSFRTHFFDEEGRAQAAAVGDSGGAVVYENNGIWELTGMMHAVSRVDEDQPNGTSIFSYTPGFPPMASEEQSTTLSADLSQYRDQIVSVIPEPGTWGLLGGLAVIVTVILGRRRRAGIRPS